MNICISREFGSGGHEIGKILAEQLGYFFYDRRLLEGAAEKSRIPIEHLERADEQKANPWIHRIWYEAEDENLRGLPANDILFQIQKDYILNRAREGNAVFVGRCGDFILKEADIPCVCIFITAPYACRVMRKKELLHLSVKETETLIRKTDKRRKAYYNYYTDGGWGKPDNYDFCINSSRGIHETVRVLEKLLEELSREGEKNE